MTRTHRILIGVVVAGAMVIAAIGFAGSYAAVRELAEQKGFGAFSLFFPIGIDAGIVVLLALDLLLTWIRIPFPLLRQTAWLLTAATIAFNGAAAWPDPLGVGMHAVIPVLFVVAVEAARHAIGRIADITADRHMESVRIARWLLAFPSTFRLWRRMKLWELRSYDEVIRLEQQRLVYQARLRARYGRAWRRKAPVESLMPLRLARYGVPLSETAPAGYAAAGIESAPPPSAEAVDRALGTGERPSLTTGRESAGHPGHETATAPGTADGHRHPEPEPTAHPEHRLAEGWQSAHPGPDPSGRPETPQITVPVGPGRVRTLSNAQAGHYGAGAAAFLPPQRDVMTDHGGPALDEQPVVGLPDDVSQEDAYYGAFRKYAADHGAFPDSHQFGRYLLDVFGIGFQDGSPLNENHLRQHVREYRARMRMEHTS
ncbi:DUF2637 domain-containing protein [Streptomyces meridianus]|uniref:DUF2637 domain-containing protein n=1 Tax=Streptomyces meridianus TaxID=2938945 RepID=UPI002557F7DE